MHSNDQTDGVNNATCGYSQGVSHMITVFLMVLLALTILLIVECSALIVIAKRQEMMSEELLKRTGSMQETSVLINPETRSQAGRRQNGSGR